MNETEMCKELITFVRLNEYRWPCLQWFYHLFNEGKRNPFEAKSVGIKAGVSDYHLPVPTSRHIGLWLEMKAPGKEPTKAQERWLSDMSVLGYQCHWCDNLQSAFLIVETYAREATAYQKQNETH